MPSLPSDPGPSRDLTKASAHGRSPSEMPLRHRRYTALHGAAVRGAWTRTALAETPDYGAEREHYRSHAPNGRMKWGETDEGRPHGRGHRRRHDGIKPDGARERCGSLRNDFRDRVFRARGD